jgi:SAM-dependent methyltransferase
VLPNHFDEAVAARYDDDSPMSSSDVLGPTVDFLAGLVGDGAALEFAVGTGRVALPLAARGVPVSGIELSVAMVDRLRAKEGVAEVEVDRLRSKEGAAQVEADRLAAEDGARSVEVDGPGAAGAARRVEVTIGDMATTRVAGRFRLVYLVFNTIGNLITQDQQAACFANAAAHLGPGGSFVIEVGVPDLRRLPPGEDARVCAHSPGYVGYDRYVDLVAQQAVSHHFFSGESGAREGTTPFRYVWPSELDLMARLAGMTLRERWADWDRSPFTGDSPSHVSVWVKAT